MHKSHSFDLSTFWSIYDEFKSRQLGESQEPKKYLLLGRGVFTYFEHGNVHMLKVTCEHSQVKMFPSVPKSKLFVH